MHKTKTQQEQQDAVIRQLQEAVAQLGKGVFDPQDGRACDAAVGILNLLVQAYSGEQGLNSVEVLDDDWFVLSMTNLHMDGVDFNMNQLSLALAILHGHKLIKAGSCHFNDSAFWYEDEDKAARYRGEHCTGVEYPGEVGTLYELYQEVQFFPEAVLEFCSGRAAIAGPG